MKNCPYLLLPQYPEEESILGSMSLGAELPNANSMLPLEFFLWVSSLPSLSLFLARIASLLSSSDLSISLRLSSTWAHTIKAMHCAICLQQPYGRDLLKVQKELHLIIWGKYYILTCCLLSISLLLSSSICFLRSFSCCSRNLCACRACYMMWKVKSEH